MVNVCGGEIVRRIARKFAMIFLFAFMINLFFIAYGKNFYETYSKVDFRVYNELLYNKNMDGKINVTIILRDKDISEIESDDVEITYKASSFNAVSASITRKGIEEIKKNENVVSVKIRPSFSLSLQDSVDKVNATSSWPVQVSGVNITGVGQTICVIDSGINYSHASLGGCTRDEFLNRTCNKVIGGYAFFNNVTADKNDVMGDSDHGTHVAGIIAANGSIKGIAPDANIVAMKACGPTSSCDYNAIIDSLNWCIGNASVYNITVISMSLGTDPPNLYSSYCDSDYTEFRDVISSAIAKNISVIAATGNNGNTTHIASPACVENATSVGGTDKSDGMYLNGNRNSITELLAPGVNINSTVLDGGYSLSSGTSMSTPHVAAAFALVRQFKRLETGKILRPSEIQDYLNDTGVVIYDSSSGLNFSRIDIYSAILSLDESFPNITLSQPADNTVTTQQNQSFACNVSDLQLKNITLHVWNSSDLYKENMSSINGTSSTASWNISLDFDSYKWNCYVCDLQDNCGYANNFSLTVSKVVVSLSSPENNTKTNKNERNFSCNISSTDQLINVSFYLWNSTQRVYDETKNITGLTNQTVFNFSFTQNAIYEWNCLVVNNKNLSEFSLTNFTLTYDRVAPSLVISGLENNSWYNLAIFNVSLNEEGVWCAFSLDNAVNVSMNRINETLFNYTNSSLSAGNHNVSFVCNDSADNFNSSSLIFFSIDNTKPNVTLESPSDSYLGTATSITINFQFNVTDNLNITKCELVLNDQVYQNNTGINSSRINTISRTLSADSYTWYVNCTDEAGNEGNSSSRSLTINQPSSEGSGGGGGGVGYKTYVTKEKEIEAGVEINLEKNDKVKFTLYETSHILTLINLTKDTAEIEILSNTIKAVLRLNETKKFNMNNDSYLDLLVRLNYMIDNKANLTIKKIHELIKVKEVKKPKEVKKVKEKVNKTDITTEKEPEIETPETKKRYISLVAVTIIVVLIVVLIKVYLRKKSKKKRKARKRKKEKRAKEKKKKEENERRKKIKAKFERK